MISTPSKTFQRHTAQLCSVKELLSGDYVVQEGWKPNFVKTSQGRKILKVNIIGFIVQKPTPFQCIVDDATGSILVVDFNNQKHVANLKVGEPVLLVGKPRKSEDTLFIAADILTNKQLKKTPAWISYRKSQLKNQPSEPTTPEVVESEHDDSNEELNVSKEFSGNIQGDDLLAFIRKKDTGDGCTVQEIIEYFGDGAEDVVLSLRAMGEVYEIRSGVLKILE
ncbi:MAG: hypothetical protein ACLFNM_00290 [Candidatus Woesearchaeota archaeon]